MDTASFRITARPLGATIVVNGDDVTHKIGVAELRVANGQPTVLTLHQHGDGIIEGEGIVQIVNPAQADADVICEFLAGIDPDQLDSDALSNADASTNLTAVMLKILQRYARGEHAAE